MKPIKSNEHDANHPKDDPRQAPESGEPGVAGRSHGQIIDPERPSDIEKKRHGQTPDAPESGRHHATPDR